jgi:hypothetical protein
MIIIDRRMYWIGAVLFCAAMWAGVGVVIAALVVLAR